MNEIIIFIIAITLATITTYISTPRLIKKLAESGHTAKDYYKIKDTQVPTMGGIAILLGILASLIFLQLFYIQAKEVLVFYFIIFSFAVFGLTDDLIDVGRKIKLLAPLFLAYPIALLNIDTNISLIFIEIEIGLLYSYLVAPIYVMVVANLVNMHSGFNGISGGTTTILLAFSGIATWIRNGPEGLIYLAPILGAMIAFMHFNKHPSKIFLGNIGTLLLGAALGSFIIFQNMAIFGIIILAPHIINFLMFVYWKIKGYEHVKFGKVDKEGILEVPNPLTLKWLLPYYFKMTEKKSVYICYLFTVISGTLGLIYLSLITKYGGFL